MNKFVSIAFAATLLAGCSNSFESLDVYSRPETPTYQSDITRSFNVVNTHVQPADELLPTYGDQSLYNDNDQADVGDDSAPNGDEAIVDNNDATHEAVACVAGGKNLTPQQLTIRSVSYQSDEVPGTLIIHTGECAAYYMLGNGQAARIRVAEGKEGFGWQGTAYVHEKRINPTWTPPSEMIARRPELAKWSNGMPGGLQENPLGTRAMYLYDEQGNDTMYRIHGTAEPQSIGHRASSGCIRVYPGQIEVLFDHMQVGSKVVVTE